METERAPLLRFLSLRPDFTMKWNCSAKQTKYFYYDRSLSLSSSIKNVITKPIILACIFIESKSDWSSNRYVRKMNATAERAEHVQN